MIVYAVSDATGELALSVTNAAVRQFKKEGVPILQRTRVRSAERTIGVVQEAHDTKGCIIFTFVSKNLRQLLLKTAQDMGVLAIDVMGPVLDSLESFLHVKPSDEPGLRHDFSSSYLKRNEAIEFSVKHDDGLGMDTVRNADIILIGISRTSKTPLSIYLSYRGYKTANVPLVRGVPIPSVLHLVDPAKLVGLTISPEKLADLRTSRLAKLGVGHMENYANIESITQEIKYANRVFQTLKVKAIIDVTFKAIEEVASDVLSSFGWV
ncbi:MAG: kinase/pyrophosphorylase [Deltaproteobacteria bacterium]|nr:MAG: kinase/pyrophosphorylase [Deltaproteobacteria bacterium]